MTWLKGRGVSVNAKDNYGNTPLHVAAYCERVVTIVELCEIGANLQARNRDGKTPRDMHSAKTFGDIILLLDCLAEKGGAGVDPARFAEIQKKKVRREFVRIVGAERIVQALGARTMDRKADCELLAVEMKNGSGETPCLKFFDESIGAWRLEAVPKGIHAVDDAIMSQFASQERETPLDS
jgi:ankyrin repeat protein